MSDTRAEAFNFFFWPVLPCIAVSIFPYSHFGWTKVSALTEQWIVYVLTTGLTVAHIHYGYGVVSF